MRPDLFVKNHIEAMDAQLTSAISTSLKQSENDNKNGNDQKAPITVHKTNVAIQKSTGNEPMEPNRDRSKYSILNPQMRSHINQDVPLLPNGSELQRRNKSIVLSHTCGFDSIVSIYGTIYIDDSIMRRVIDESTSRFANFIQLLFERNKIDSKIEFARYEFLKEIFPNQEAIKELKNLTSFNCETAIDGLFRSMCTINADILSSRQRMEKCSSCEHEHRMESPFVNYNANDFDFKDVQKSIVPERVRVCNDCQKKTMTIEDQFHDVVVIDCEPLIKNNKLTTSIENIAKQISLNDDEYVLFAVIQYDSNIKHFIPHIRRPTNTWECYDDLQRTKSNTNIKDEMQIFMLFYRKKLSGMYLGASIHVS